MKHLRYYHEINADLTLVFECVDIEKDPHIIKYEKSTLVLLDAIYNTLEFKTVPYDNLVDFAKTKIGCPVKDLAYEVKSWEDFRDLYNDNETNKR